jgi:hypothetical protein
VDQELFDQLTEQSKNTISAKVICDSVNPDGVRLTTMEWTYPRMIHSEIMTHRKLSRNAASSRAIPLSKMIQRVTDNPVFPIHWGKNQKGMQANEELLPDQKTIVGMQWIRARNEMIARAKYMEEMGIHKQIGNRLLEPWMWITVIVSATNFENLFALRCHPAAEPHFQNLAYKVRDALDASDPMELEWGEWHLPFFGRHGGSWLDKDDNDENISTENRPEVSAGRCARVSYLTHDGKRDPAEDIRLYQQLAGSFPIHASPLEHPAQATQPNKSRWPNSWWEYKEQDWGNFDPGWLQFRKMHEHENITKRPSQGCGD